MYCPLRRFETVLVTLTLLALAVPAGAQPAEPAEPETDEQAEPVEAPETAPPPASEPAPAEPTAPQEPLPASDEAEPVAAPPQVAPAEPSPEPIVPPVEPVVEPESEERSPALVITPSFFTRYELRRGYGKLGVGNARFRDFDAVAYRARFKMAVTDISLGDKASLDVVLNPQSSGFWNGSGGLVDAPLDLHEGYIMPRFMKTSWLQVGRFEMIYGDHWLIGNVAWHQTGRSFDGARLHLQSRDAAGPWIDFFFNVLDDGFSDPMTTANDRIGAGDTYLVGAYADIGAWITEGMNLDLYALANVWPGTDELDLGDGMGPVGRDGAAELTAGSRAKGTLGIFTYRIEGGLQAGERAVGAAVTDVLAGAIDVEAGVKAHPKLWLAGEGFYASGDDPDTAGTNEAWADRFSTAHKWLGLMDVMGTRTNVMGGTFHAKANATDALTLGTQVHFFARPQLPDEPGYYGTELDFFGVLGLLPGLKLRADYDIFLPDADTFGGDAKPAHYLGVELGYAGQATFGG